MPSRYVQMIGEHNEADKAREAERGSATLADRFKKLLDRINPRKDPALLKPVEGANLMTEWERAFGQLGSLIILDELATLLLQALPEKDAQLNAELELLGELGPERARRIPEISLAEYRRIARDLEEPNG